MNIDTQILEIKEIRIEQQKLNDRIELLAKERPPNGAELTLARRSGQTVRHWLGESLGELRRQELLDDPHPYPDGDKVNTKIAKESDI